MIRMGTVSKLGSSEVIEKAVGFFGPSGLRMNVQEQSDGCARFEGAGGYVFIQTADIIDHEGSSVNVEGRQWDYHINRFMGEN